MHKRRRFPNRVEYLAQAGNIEIGRRALHFYEIEQKKTSNDDDDYLVGAVVQREMTLVWQLKLVSVEILSSSEKPEATRCCGNRQPPMFNKSLRANHKRPTMVA